MQARFALAPILLLDSVAPLAAAAADTGESDRSTKKSYRRGDLRLGVFFVTQIDSKVAVDFRAGLTREALDLEVDDDPPRRNRAEHPHRLADVCRHRLLTL